MSRLIATLLVSVAALSPFAAQAAGFGLSSLPGVGGKSSDSGAADMTGAQDQLVKQYVGAGKNVIQGNAGMAEALGLKTEAAALLMAGDNMGDGATKGNLADADKATSESNQKIAAAMKNTTTLDAESKVKYAAGMAVMAQGLMKYVGMKDSFNSFASGLKSVSPMALTKLQSGAYIVTSLPTNMSNLATALNNAVAFAKSQNIEVSSNVTDATKNMKF